MCTYIIYGSQGRIQDFLGEGASQADVSCPKLEVFAEELSTMYTSAFANI